MLKQLCDYKPSGNFTSCTLTDCRNIKSLMSTCFLIKSISYLVQTAHECHYSTGAFWCHITNGNTKSINAGCCRQGSQCAPVKARLGRWPVVTGEDTFCIRPGYCWSGAGAMQPLSNGKPILGLSVAVPCWLMLSRYVKLGGCLSVLPPGDWFGHGLMPLFVIWSMMCRITGKTTCERFTYQRVT